MRNLSFLFASIVAMGSVACVTAADSEPNVDEVAHAEQEIAVDSETTIDASTYYIVTRPDFRRCAWPMCGGYFVKRVNQATTKCADGVWRDECHVVDLDTSDLGVDDVDADKFGSTFSQGFGLVRGRLKAVSLGFAVADTLIATDAWVAEAASVPTGSFYALTSSGIQCITFPCPVLHEQKLNTRNAQNIAAVDLAASGASERQVDAGFEELWSRGILVAGTHGVVSGPAGQGKQLVASEFYTRLKPSTPDTQACGGIAGLQCPADQVCDIDIPNACGGYDLSGICKAVPDFCTEQYEPVCGCDGVTYGNDCFRLMAGAQLENAGECQAASAAF